jgi:cytochrome b subunit of formate dehydrogenase
MSRELTRTRRSSLVATGPLLAFVLGLLLAPAGARAAQKVKAPSNEDCLGCHQDPDAKRESGSSIAVLPEPFGKSVHGPMSCVDCHVDLATTADFPHKAKLKKVDCASCHEDEPKQLRASVHARVTAGPDGPDCVSCHGPAHQILPRTDPASTVSKVNLPATCGSCHSNPDFLARHKIPFARPVDAYRLSVHGRAVARGSQEAASCSDCHGSHGVLPPQNPASKTNHFKVPETCGSCHKEVARTYAESVHGTAAARGVMGSPVCTDCHGEHALLAPSEPNSLVNPARVSTVTCGRCHADERLAERYNLPKENVPAYQGSYHGLAQRSGKQTVANCASFHGVHNILPSSHPRSTINTANLAKTCGACHPGAGGRFAIGSIHVKQAGGTEHLVVRSIRLAYLVLIPLTLGLMILHNLLDFLAKLWRGTRRGADRDEVPRMNLHFRIAHALVIVSFPLLVITGFALKYPEAWWAAPLLWFENGVSFRGGLHRVSAVLLILSFAYHVVHLILVPKDRVLLRQMWPRLKDATDLIAVLRYNLGRLATRPTFSMFNYAEKAEYWAFMWGTAVMVLSGFILWFNNFSLSYFPTWVSDAATAVHFYEAILATFSILVWHFYMTIFDPEVYPMDLAWITGKASAEHVRHTRPSYYRRLLAAMAPSKDDSESNPPPPDETGEPS